MIQFILLFIVLTVLQLVCNKIVLWGVAMPVVFIYLILRLPVNLHGGWVLTIAFFSGLIIDIFDNTPGMNALACTLMAAVRRPVSTNHNNLSSRKALEFSVLFMCS
ncbi:MAG: rod shape-determining protein MreD [Muribaculaceae bacterium]|nr:rod shape-determining protein MreD [Muribaculaceae bacterium]